MKKLNKWFAANKIILIRLFSLFVNIKIVMIEFYVVFACCKTTEIISKMLFC